MPTTDFDEFTCGYIECALWSESIDHDTSESFDFANYDATDLSADAVARIKADCADFQQANAADLAAYAQRFTLAQAGHDFWLTRNRHGAGFWDRGLGELGTRLSTAAHAYGSCSLALGDDGQIYVG